MAKLTIQDHGPNKIQTIRHIREAIGCGLAEAKALAEGDMVWALGEITHKQAKNIRECLNRAVGVKFTISGLKRSAKPKEKPKPKTWHERLIGDD